MRSFWEKVEAGQPVQLGLVGSSVGMSAGCQAQYQPQLRCSKFDGEQLMQGKATFARGSFAPSGVPVHGFAMQALDWLNATWPHPQHKLWNAAADAWTAQAIEPCLMSNQQLIASDLILLELGSQSWHPHQIEASERMIRKLLLSPSAPALVLVTVRRRCTYKYVH